MQCARGRNSSGIRGYDEEADEHRSSVEGYQDISEHKEFEKVQMSGSIQEMSRKCDIRRFCDLYRHFHFPNPGSRIHKEFRSEPLRVEQIQEDARLEKDVGLESTQGRENMVLYIQWGNRLSHCILSRSLYD